MIGNPTAEYDCRCPYSSPTEVRWSAVESITVVAVLPILTACRFHRVVRVRKRSVDGSTLGSRRS